MTINFAFERGDDCNEWLAIYIDDYGDKCIFNFDTFEQAVEFLSKHERKVGVMTAEFYERCMSE